MFAQFSKSANAAVAAVRLPQPAPATQSRTLLGTLPKAPRPTPAAPPTARQQHRADQARYQAKCRVAMSF